MNHSLKHKVLPQTGYDIHYFISGELNKPLVILLHPAFSDHRVFDSQVSILSQRYRVICIDLIGHGLSQVRKSKDKIDSSSRHIGEIMQKEKYTTAHLVGVSLGSLIAQFFAVENPEKVLSLTALGGYDINKKTEEVIKTQRSSNIGLVFKALFSIKSFRKQMVKTTTHTTSGRQKLYECSSLYTRKSFMVMSGFNKIVCDRDFIPTFPLMIMVGAYDIPLAIKMSEIWHQNQDGSEYIVIPNTGHCANLDNPVFFNSILLEFIFKGEQS